MLNTKFGQKMDEMYMYAMEWLKANPYQEPDAEVLRVATLGVLTKGYARFSDATSRAQTEGDEFKAASVELSQADRGSEDAYKTLTFRAQGYGLTIRADSEDKYEVYQAAMNHEFGAVTPSAFNAMDADASLDVLEKATGFCEKHFGANDADVVAAQKAHARLDECRRRARREESEYATAMSTLIKARDDARRYYSAARDVLSGAMRLVESDLLSRIMPPLSSIYRTPQSAEAPEAPAVEPAEPAEPAPAPADGAF